MILVFKTDVSCPEAIAELQPTLNRLPADTTWNFDLDDCDRILRVASHDISPEEFVSLLAQVGYRCEELA